MPLIGMHPTPPAAQAPAEDRSFSAFTLGGLSVSRRKESCERMRRIPSPSASQARGAAGRCARIDNAGSVVDDWDLVKPGATFQVHVRSSLRWRFEAKRLVGGRDDLVGFLDQPHGQKLGDRVGEHGDVSGLDVRMHDPRK